MNMRWTMVILICTLSALCAPMVFLFWLPKEKAPARNEQTIITLMPSLTEMAYAMGLGDRVVGVGSYCDFPPEVDALPRYGGLDVDVERILQRAPGWVWMVKSQEVYAEKLRRGAVRVLVLEEDTLDGFRSNVARVGATFGVDRHAREFLKQFDDSMQAVRSRFVEAKPRSVMLITDRSLDRLANLYAVTGTVFLNEFITMAGGRNVFAERDGPSFSPTIEDVVAANPEVIIDCSLSAGSDAQALVAQWMALTSVQAVKDKQVHLLDLPGLVRPGARTPHAVEQLAYLIHPELRENGK